MVYYNKTGEDTREGSGLDVEEQKTGQVWKSLGILAAAAAGLLLLGWLIVRITLAFSSPGTEAFRDYLRMQYDKDFEIVRRYTYTDWADGERSRPIYGCPAVEFEDPETGVRFSVRARSTGAVLGELTMLGDWYFTDDFADRTLRFCAEEQGLTIVERDRGALCLDLSNDRETAEKMQRMASRFNALLAEKPEAESRPAFFSLPNGYRLTQVIAGNVSDCWLGQTSPFCYDTPIEKYESFLAEALG